MVWPLLALGLLAGNEWMRQKKLDELKGEGPQAMGPPTAEGEMGYSGGRGLLADPADPKRQADFALGIMGMPGYARMGSEMLAGAQGRMQQGSQFDQSLAQRGSQFDQSQRQQADQFNRSQAQQGDQFSLNYQQHGAQLEQAAAQWLQQFKANQAETNARLGLAGRAQANDDARLGLARDAANIKADGLPKLSPGWMYTDSASGLVAAPVPGTPDYEKVSKGESSSLQGIAAVNRMRDIMMGKEETTPQGNLVRRGGAGTEMFGPTVKTYDAIHGQLVTALGQMSDAGVINVGELERYEAMLPNPGNKSTVFTWNTTMDKAYDEIGKKLEAKLAAHRRANPWLVPPPPKGAQVTQ